MLFARFVAIGEVKVVAEPEAVATVKSPPKFPLALTEVPPVAEIVRVLLALCPAI